MFLPGAAQSCRPCWSDQRQCRRSPSESHIISPLKVLHIKPSFSFLKSHISGTPYPSEYHIKSSFLKYQRSNPPSPSKSHLGLSFSFLKSDTSSSLSPSSSLKHQAPLFKVLQMHNSTPTIPLFLLKCLSHPPEHRHDCVAVALLDALLCSIYTIHTEYTLHTETKKKSTINTNTHRYTLQSAVARKCAYHFVIVLYSF